MQSFQQNTNNMLQAAAVAAAAAAATTNNDNLFNSINLQHQQQANQYHQELVKSYLNHHQQQQHHHQNSMSPASSLISPPSSNHSSATLGAMSNTSCSSNSSNSNSSANGATNQSPSCASSAMATFAARLMSLNPYELKCLNADNELMRRINETQLLIESRLIDLHSSLTNNSQQNGLTDNARSHQQSQQQKQQQQQISSNNQQQQLNKQIFQQHHHHQQQQQQQQSSVNLNNLKQPLQEQQQQFLLSSTAVGTNDYYQNYYAQQLLAAQQQMAQQIHHHHQQQQQQLYLLNSRLNTSNNLNHLNHDSVSQDLSSSNLINSNGAPPLQMQQLQVNARQKSHSGSTHQQHQHSRSGQPALDLRTTPTRPVSVSPLSPISSRAASTGSVASCQQAARQPTPQQHPKKMKLSAYQKMQNEHSENIYEQSNVPNHAAPKMDNLLSAASLSSASSGGTSTRAAASRQQQQQQQTSSVVIATGGNSKKYKGEFDEPSPAEVAERQLQLNRPDHYHRHALDRSECACVIGSEFPNKTKHDALQLLDNWRSLDIEERIKWKWDISDLPKDIPLSDIKKFEDLRRDFSNGRADFGGASKRKPLGIRGTRQFLLMLYCLWGHPGREDPMQQDGYCPHCFARIRTENEQSTLVRVVNHFNMKHRRGANPRLSPRLEAASNQASSSSLMSMLTTSTLLRPAESQSSKVSATVASAAVTASPTASNDIDSNEPQSPQLEVARTLLSMVESTAAMDTSSSAANNVESKSKDKTADGSKLPPEQDTENRDPGEDIKSVGNSDQQQALEQGADVVVKLSQQTVADASQSSANASISEASTGIQHEQPQQQQQQNLPKKACR